MLFLNSRNVPFCLGLATLTNMPEEVRIGKFAEIYVYAAEDALFFERKLLHIIIVIQFNDTLSLFD